MANTPFEFKFDNPVLGAHDIAEDWIKNDDPDQLGHPKILKTEKITYFEVMIDGERYVKKVTEIKDYKAHSARPLPLNSWSTEII